MTFFGVEYFQLRFDSEKGHVSSPPREQTFPPLTIKTTLRIFQDRPLNNKTTFMDGIVEDEKKTFDAENAQDDDAQPDPDEHLMLDQGNGRVWLVKVRTTPPPI